MSSIRNEVEYAVRNVSAETFSAGRTAERMRITRFLKNNAVAPKPSPMA